MIILQIIQIAIILFVPCGKYPHGNLPSSISLAVLLKSVDLSTNTSSDRLSSPSSYNSIKGTINCNNQDIWSNLPHLILQTADPSHSRKNYLWDRSTKITSGYHKMVAQKGAVFKGGGIGNY